MKAKGHSAASVPSAGGGRPVSGDAGRPTEHGFGRQSLTLADPAALTGAAPEMGRTAAAIARTSRLPAASLGSQPASPRRRIASNVTPCESTVVCLGQEMALRCDFTREGMGGSGLLDQRTQLGPQSGRYARNRPIAREPPTARHGWTTVSRQAFGGDQVPLGLAERTRCQPTWLRPTRHVRIGQQGTAEVALARRRLTTSAG